MRTLKIMAIILMSLSVTSQAFAADGDKAPKKKIRYTKGKKLDFESILIEGHLKRPEMSVVTGDVNGEDEGLLKLREDFLDHMAIDLGVEVQ
jgi:hypothetical protein